MDLYNLIHTAAKLGAAEALQEAGVTSGEISQKEACRIYGRYFTEAVKAGRLHPVAQGPARNSKKSFKVADILALKASDQAATILTNNTLTL